MIKILFHVCIKINGILHEEHWENVSKDLEQYDIVGIFYKNHSDVFNFEIDNLNDKSTCKIGKQYMEKYNVMLSFCSKIR